MLLPQQNRAARRAQKAKSRKQECQPQTSAQSRSRAQPADRPRLTYDGLRYGLAKIAEIKGEWAGIPTPLNEEQLVIEPSYPHAEAFMAIGRKSQDPAADDGLTLINKWYCRARRCDVLLINDNGKVELGIEPAFHHISHDMRTMGCADAWSVDNECAATELLASMISARQLKQYLLTGMFLETSKRSGVTYMFRRLKPTVALAARPGLPESKHGKLILCCLCMHPIAYYEGSWAGAMCPTDDVVAHIGLMRADEKMFWRRCNQHPAYRPEAGL